MADSWTMGSGPLGEIKKITFDQFSKWCHEYWNNPGTMRYGEAFLKALFPHVVDPELLYDDQPLRALDRIEKFYLISEPSRKTAGNVITVSRQFADSQGHSFSASWQVEQDKDGVWEGYFSGSCMYSVEFRCRNEAELWGRIAEQHGYWVKMLNNLFPEKTG